MPTERAAPPPKTHPLEWAALACSIVALSYTEWSLAVAAGAHPVVAVAVPGALDIYAVRAMRVRRHVPVVVLAMVGVNALSYLVHAGVVPVTWPVLIIVSAIAPLVFWAVHVLGHGEHVPDLAERRVRKLWDVPDDRPDVHDPVPDTDALDEHVDTLPVHVDEWGTDVHVPFGNDRVPARFLLPEELEEHGVPVLQTHPFPEHAPERDTPATVLPLPDGFERAPRRTRTQLLAEGRARYAGEDTLPSVRDIKRELCCNTPGAQAVLQDLKEKREKK